MICKRCNFSGPTRGNPYVYHVDKYLDKNYRNLSRVPECPLYHSPIWSGRTQGECNVGCDALFLCASLVLGKKIEIR